MQSKGNLMAAHDQHGDIIRQSQKLIRNVAGDTSIKTRFGQETRYEGTVSNAQRYKGLVTRFNAKKKKSLHTVDNAGSTSKFIQPGSVLRVKLDGNDREKQFVLLALSDSFMANGTLIKKTFKLLWEPTDMKKVKTRLIARKCLSIKAVNVNFQAV